MKPSAAGSHTSARCPRCGNAFDCGMHGQPFECWCRAMPSLPADRLEAGRPCLCPECLAAEIARAALQWAGAAYLLWMAWNAVKPGARSVLQPRTDLPIDGPRRLFAMGFLTNMLNPKAAVLYLSLLPQFIDPARGNVLGQGVTLGLVQIAISFSVNLAIVMTAGSVASWFSGRPVWLRVQRWLMAGVLTGLAMRLALEKRPA